MVARIVRDDEAVGSSPTSPTKKEIRCLSFSFESLIKMKFNVFDGREYVLFLVDEMLKKSYILRIKL